MFKEISSIVTEEVTEMFYSLVTRIIEKKYGKKSTPCFLVVEEDGFRFKTKYTTGYRFGTETIRREVGQNILQTFGLTNDPPVIVLVLLPSTVKKLGLKSTYDFIKEWKGQSLVEDKIAVVYKVL